MTTILRSSVPPATGTHEPGARNYAAVAAAPAVGGVTPLNQYRGTPSNQQRFRKRSILVYGNATTGKDDTEEILAADIELVATGVAKDATSDQLKDFIVSKGINVLEITKLTTFEYARTNTFKIKIRAAQYSEAMKPENWPFRVGVRHYRQPRSTGSSWSEQVGRAGGVINQQRGPHQQGGPPQHQQYNHHQDYRQQQGYKQGSQYHLSQSQEHHQQYQNQNYNNLELQNRFVVEGFANNVHN